MDDLLDELDDIDPYESIIQGVKYKTEYPLHLDIDALLDKTLAS